MTYRVHARKCLWILKPLLGSGLYAFYYYSPEWNKAFVSCCAHSCKSLWIIRISSNTTRRLHTFFQRCMPGPLIKHRDIRREVCELNLENPCSTQLSIAWSRVGNRYYLFMYTPDENVLIIQMHSNKES